MIKSFLTTISVIDLKSRIISCCPFTKKQTLKIVLLVDNSVSRTDAYRETSKLKGAIFSGKLNECFHCMAKITNGAYQSQVSVKGVTVFCVYMYGEEWETADFHC